MVRADCSPNWKASNNYTDEKRGVINEADGNLEGKWQWGTCRRSAAYVPALNGRVTILSNTDCRSQQQSHSSPNRPEEVLNFTVVEPNQ